MPSAVQTSRGLFTHRHGWWVALETEEGILGLGEAATWPGFGSEDAALVGESLVGAQELVAGQDLSLCALDAWQESLSAVPEAGFALGCAALDAMARMRGVSLAQFLGEDVRQEIIVHRLVRDASQAREAVAQGYRALKIKVGVEDPGLMVARLKAIREVVGPDVLLRADANGAWSVAQVQAILPLLVSLDLDWVEQPLDRGESLDVMASLRRAHNVALAWDESICDEGALRALLEAEAADVVVLKPMFLGDPRQSFRLAVIAREQGVRVMMTHALETGLGRLAALHLACACEVPLEACGLAGRAPGIWQVPDVVRGVLPLPKGAGLGAGTGEITVQSLREAA